MRTILLRILAYRRHVSLKYGTKPFSSMSLFLPLADRIFPANPRILSRTNRSASRLRKNWEARDQSGFSLVEVALAVGLCTFVLCTMFSLLSVGMVTIQSASRQIAEAEIFNRLGSQFSTTPFYSLQNTNNGVGPLFTNPTSPIYFYYDNDGQDITALASAASTAVYTARCTLVNSQTNPDLTATVPPVDGGVRISGPSLTFIRIQVGFHFDPANLPPGQTEPRVSTRTFLIAKRDTWDGS